MAFIVVSITRDFGRIRFFEYIATLSQSVSFVDSAGKEEVFLVLFWVLLTSFFLFPSFLGGFSIISASRSCYFLSPDFGFFIPQIFYRVA